jgi:hypothetical protein
MHVIGKLLPGVLFVLVHASSAYAAADAAIFRIFLKDGTSVASFGEYARANDRVVYSMPVGGTLDDPRLHLVWLPASSVDWPRTEKYAASARFQRYALTRGEDDFRALSNDVARVLNDIALSTDRKTALAMAEQARRALADWPRTHYGYRQNDVREIVSLIDESIAELRAAGGATAFELSLVASAAEPEVELEPMLPLPSPREQLQQTLHLAGVIDHPSDRLALLHSALAMIGEPGTGLGEAEAVAMRRYTERRVGEELDVDRKYATVAARLLAQATRAAERARITSVERVLSRIDREDARLGRRRPDAVSALRSSVEARLADARQLRLLRDQWQVRRSIYQDYQRMVGGQIKELMKAQAALEAIRRLDGPKLDALSSLKFKLSGGAGRLERLLIPADLRTTHDLLVGAWRFAEVAVRNRDEAVSTGNLGTAWEASSAAAGSLMLLSRAQGEIRTLLEPPRIQ